MKPMFSAGLLLLVPFAALAQPPALANIKIETIEGSLSIKGTSPYTGGTCSVIINGAVVIGKDGNANNDCGYDTTKNDGSFEFVLTNPLVVHQFVQFTMTIPSLAKQPPTISQEVAPSLRISFDTVREGDTAVSGRILNTTTDNPISNVCVDMMSGSILVQHIDATFDSGKGTFSANLTKAAVEDQTVQVELFRTPSTKSSSTAPASCSSPGLIKAAANSDMAVVQSSGYDWGRVKLYFTLGTLWTKQDTATTATASNTTTTQTGFNSPTAFLSMNLDYNWYTLHAGALKGCPDKAKVTGVETYVRPGMSKERLLKLQDKMGPKFLDHVAKICQGTGNFTLTLNTYAQASLTQIPLTNTMTSSNTTSSGTANISQFQGGYFEGGTYIPLIPSWTQWTYQGQNNALFLAPLGKFGFQGFGSNVMGNGGTSAMVANPTSSEVNRFYAGGFRIGHFKMPADSNKSGPELISWVDFTAGRWNNCRETTGNVGTHFDVTGQLKIPATVFNIGFDVNVGPGGDYLGIFVGSRLDVGSLLGKLTPTAK